MVHLLVVIFLFVLTGICWRIDRSKLYPPFIFSGIWAFTLLVFMLFGGEYFEISDHALVLYASGSFFFFLGGVASQQIYKANTKNRIISPRLFTVSDTIGLSIILNSLFFVLVLGMLYVLLESREFSLNLAEILDRRRVGIDSSGQSRELSFVRNLPVFGSIMLILIQIAYSQSILRNWRFLILFVLTVLVGIASTGSKGIILGLLLVAFFINSTKKGFLDIRTLFLVITIGIAAFLSGLVFFSYSFISSGESFGDVFLQNFDSLSSVLLDYWLGSSVAFSKFLDDPNSFLLTQSLSRSLLEMANNFGANISLSSLHADYVCVTLSQCGINTYTLYFSFYGDYGWAGVTIGMFLFGYISTQLYLLAKRGYPYFIALYAILLYALVMSFHAELFFSNLNYILKFTIIYFAIMLLSRAFRYLPISVSNSSGQPQTKITGYIHFYR